MLRNTTLSSSGALRLTALPLLALTLAAPHPAGAQASPAASSPAPEANAAATQAIAPATTPSAADGPPPGGTPAATGTTPPSTLEVKRAVYVPETVKAQIREEIKQEVIAQAKQEGWAAPNVVPKWLQRLKLGGDVRGRFDRTIFPSGNANTGEFPDFAAINSGGPADVRLIDTASDKYLDVDQDRTRPRLRARMGVDADVAPGVTAGLRLASGEGSTPVSTNQTLGGSAGDFSKYQFWLDRVFIRAGTRPDAPSGIAAQIGRFENPFFSTELIWSDTVSLDGIAVLGRMGVGGGVTVFASAGAFPSYTTAFAFPADHTAKFPSRNKWLYAAQLGGEWRPAPDFALKLGVAFYDFDGIEGRVSSPCDTNLKSVTCDTDDTRPSFAQKGNTYMALRTPNDSALIAERLQSASRYEYFGLFSRFREVAATGRLELPGTGGLRPTVDAELVANVGLWKRRPGVSPLNNADHCDESGCSHFLGGRYGYLARVTLGTPRQDVRWSWNASLGYRRLESDAVVDAFTDPDFGLGGTNLKGFVVGASVVLADNVTATARWLSADAIVGPPYRVDVLQTDLSARF